MDSLEEPFASVSAEAALRRRARGAGFRLSGSRRRAFSMGLGFIGLGRRV